MCHDLYLTSDNSMNIFQALQPSRKQFGTSPVQMDERRSSGWVPLLRTSADAGYFILVGPFDHLELFRVEVPAPKSSSNNFCKNVPSIVL